jgi:RNA polymerase sigma factor (sigma-70 family)
MPEYKNNLHVLYTEFAGELTAFVRRRVGAVEADDVVQETYLRVMQYANQIELEHPRAYLFRIAANVTFDHNKVMKSDRDRFDSEVDPDSFHSEAPDQEADCEARQRLQRCLAALERMPAIYRHVFLLHRIDGMTQSEIAEALDMPKRTVERYIARALERCLKVQEQE